VAGPCGGPALGTVVDDREDQRDMQRRPVHQGRMARRLPEGRPRLPQARRRAAPLLRLRPALAGRLDKELAAYLGHNDPGFTLRTYTHLVP
jgi:hypothetical protein